MMHVKTGFYYLVLPFSTEVFVRIIRNVSKSMYERKDSEWILMFLFSSQIIININKMKNDYRSSNI